MVCVWNAETLELAQVFDGLAKSPSSLAWLAGGQQIVYMVKDVIAAMDVETGFCVRITRVESSDTNSGSGTGSSDAPVSGRESETNAPETPASEPEAESPPAKRARPASTDSLVNHSLAPVVCAQLAEHLPAYGTCSFCRKTMAREKPKEVFFAKCGFRCHNKCAREECEQQGTFRCPNCRSTE